MNISKLQNITKVASSATKNWRTLPEFSVESFLENRSGWEMDPLVLKKYLDKAAKQSLINF